MTGSVLSVRGLNKRYGKRTVVKDVSLDIASGEVVGLLASTGSSRRWPATRQSAPKTRPPCCTSS